MNIEILTAILVIAGVTIFFLFQSISELHKKIDILMNDAKINWEQYLTSDIRERIEKKEFAKAAGMLRSETGLSLKQCMVIIESSKDKNT